MSGRSTMSREVLGVPASWDEVASAYALDVMPTFAFYAEEALRLVPLDHLSHILDIASGPGTLAFCAAPRVAHVSAIDFSLKMIEELRAHAARNKISNVKAEVMDAQSLAFSASTFDAAFCLFAITFFPDRGRALGEIFRVVRPGGRVLVATWGPMERRGVVRLVAEAMAEAFPQIPPTPKGELEDVASCIQELNAAGFHEVATHAFTASLRIESAEHCLDMMERSGAGFSDLRRGFGAAWPHARVRLLNAIRRRVPERGTETSAEALLTIGVR